jgi:uncharacterized membrane protein YgdD (TMEM256/DUF423 family)
MNMRYVQWVVLGLLLLTGFVACVLLIVFVVHPIEDLWYWFFVVLILGIVCISVSSYIFALLICSLWQRENLMCWPWSYKPKPQPKEEVEPVPV